MIFQPKTIKYINEKDSFKAKLDDKTALLKATNTFDVFYNIVHAKAGVHDLRNMVVRNYVGHVMAHQLQHILIEKIKR